MIDKKQLVSKIAETKLIIIKKCIDFSPKVQALSCALHLDQKLILRVERAKVGLGLGHLQRRRLVLGRVLLVGESGRLEKVERERDSERKQGMEMDEKT